MGASNLNDLNFRLSLADVQKMGVEEKDAVRYRIQTDLRFLTNCIMRPRSKKFISYSEKVQGRIIDAFPKCDPDKDILEWENMDEFIVLASRGMLKSTIGMAFLTQVILSAPDVRILIMSGKIEKASSILEGARKPFFSNEVLRYLFPEWAIDDSFLTAETFTTPKRNPELNEVLRDPTMSVASFDSVKAGGHYEIILLDDATNEQNSSNPENCAKTHGTYDDCDELLEPGGLKVFLATRWHSEDLPQYIKAKADADKELSGIQTLSYFVLPAWTLRADGTPRDVLARQDREKHGTLTAADVDLTWPEKLTARFLFKKYNKNRADFYKQYLLDASLDETAKSFTEEILRKQITSPNDLKTVPMHDRSVVVHWDLASAFTGRRKKSDTDYSCGIIAVFQNSTGKMFVVDAVLAHFNTGSDVANAMIRLHKIAAHFGPIVGHSMEDAVGARYLEEQIYAVAKSQNVKLTPIQWQLPTNEKNAKNLRIALLASAMKDGWVWILSNINFIGDIRAQFENWSIDAKRRKDDGPDCVAQIWQVYRSLILPKSVSTMMPEGPVISWEADPDPQVALMNAEEDAAKREGERDADMDWLNSFTVPHT